MGTFVVQHEWDTKRSPAVQQVISSMVKQASADKLPKGYTLLNLFVEKNEMKAYCVWNAPSKGDLVHLLDQLDPSDHTVKETDCLFTADKVVSPSISA